MKCTSEDTRSGHPWFYFRFKKKKLFCKKKEELWSTRQKQRIPHCQ